MSELPPLIEPQQLEPLLGRDNLLVVDLSKGTTHQQLHIPGAVFLEYERIIANRKPAYGLLPPLETLEQVLSETGIGNRTHVVAYDDEGGGKACRLLWTLDTLGHAS
ncbi:MAG: thiosulfate sulfurtransferase, partial [Candidatus Sedimenticola endophacoides]